MTREELAVAQQEGASSALASLVARCESRFVRAADLVGVRGQVIEGLRQASVIGGTDLTPLLPVWGTISRRYREELYDAQASLLEPHREEVPRRWWAYVHRELFPSLLRDDEFVRNVLRAIGLLPCRSRSDAIASLVLYVAEMSLARAREVYWLEDSV